MSNPQIIADHYIAAWNETDGDRRIALLRQHWNEDAAYVDPMANVAGIRNIDHLIAAVQERFPGFRFALTGQPDGHGQHVRFSWTLGPSGAEPPIEGSDVVSLAEDRIASVIGFLDRVPSVTSAS